MGFVIAWPKYNIDEHEVVVDATAIVDAAAQARPIWADDIDLPADDLDPQTWQGRNFSSGIIAFAADDTDDELDDP